MKRGFTLVELLGVLIILAALFTIVTSLTTDLVKNSKTKTLKNSIDLYGKAVNEAVLTYELENKVSPKKFEDIIPYIQYKGAKVECETSYLKKDGRVYLSGCKVNDKEVSEYVFGTEEKFDKKKKICEAVTMETANKLADGISIAGNIPQGNYSIGDEYICEVKDDAFYHFYIVSVEGDMVNLIHDSNVTSNGEPVKTRGISDETSAWCTDSDYGCVGIDDYCALNDKGPITLMKTFYKVTKTWDNIPDIIINYGTTIKTSGTLFEMFDRQGEVTYSVNNLKARPPYDSEMMLNNYGDDWPVYLRNYLDWDLNNCVSTDAWSYTSLEGSARDGEGTISQIGMDSGSMNNYYSGIRPVINVYKTNLY